MLMPTPAEQQIGPQQKRARDTRVISVWEQKAGHSATTGMYQAIAASRHNNNSKTIDALVVDTTLFIVITLQQSLSATTIQ